MPTGMPSRRRLGLVAQPLRQQHERPGAEPSTFVSMHRRLDRRGERVARLLQKLVGRRTFSCLHPDPLRGTDHQEHSESFGRRIDAERFLTDQEGRKARGEWIDPKLGEESLASYYGRWSDRAQATGKPSERTLIAYAEIWHRFIGPALGVRALASLTRTDCQAVVDKASSPWRAMDVRKALSSVLGSAIRDDLIARNPASRLAIPRIEQDEPPILTMTQVEALSEASSPVTRRWSCSGPTARSAGASWSGSGSKTWIFCAGGSEWNGRSWSRES